MASSDLELKLNISANAADAIQALQKAKEGVERLSDEAEKAKTDAAQLKQSFDAQASAVDHLGIQLALAKKALKDLSDSGINKTHADYQALEGEIQVLEGQFKRQNSELKTTEAAYQKAAREASRLDATLIKQKNSINAQSAALKSAGVDVAHLSMEYQRLNKAAKLDEARRTLDVKPFQEVEAEIRKLEAAFETLKKSGKLSQGELAQASLKTRERIDELRHSTNGWSDSLVKARGAFLEAGLAVGGLAAATHQAIQFETAMAQVAKTTGMNAEQTAQLADKLKTLSTEIPISAEALAGMAAAAGQMGIANDSIEAFVRLAAAMSTTFDIPAEQAGESIAKLANNFQLSIPQVERLGDAINVLGNNMAAKESDITDAMARIGGTAKQFGLSAEQAAALSATLLSMGMPAEVAGTAINAMLTKLQAARVGSTEFKDGLQQIGLSAEQMADMVSANPQQALTTLLNTLDKLDAQTRAEVLVRLFGAEHSDEIARLVNGLKDYDQALERVGDTAGIAGSMQREFEVKLQSTQARLDMLVNSAKVAAANLGEVFLPAIRAIADNLKSATTAVGEFEQAMPKTAGLAAGLATAAASVGALRVAWLALASVGAKAFDWIGGIGPAATQGIGEALASVGKLKTALSILSAGMVGWEIGTWARKEFEGVYKIGVAIAAGLTRLAEQIRYRWEQARATMTADTLEAATQRHEQRLQEIDDIYSELFTQWKTGTDQQTQSTQKLTEETAKLAPELMTAGKAMDAFAGAGASAALTEFTQKLKDSSAGGKEAADSWKSYVESLETADLAKIIEEASAKMAQLTPVLGANSEQVQQLANVVDTALRESFNRVGIDANQALTGVSSNIQKSVGDIDALSKALKASGTEGEKAGAAIVQAFRDLIGKAKNPQELQLIKTRLDALSQGAQSGTPAFRDLTKAYQELTAAQDKIAPSADRAQIAMEKQQASAIAWNAVSREHAQHNATVAAQNRQNAAEEQAQAEARQRANATQIQDGERLSVSYDMATAALLAWGEAGQRALEMIARTSSGSFDLYFKMANEWTQDAQRQLDAVNRITQSLATATQTGEGLSQAIRQAQGNFDKLDANHLEGLKQAIDAAKQKMDSLQDSARSTLKSLQQELLQLTGTAAEVERFQYQQKRLDLQKQLNDAQAAGNAKAIGDLQKALGLQTDIYQKRLEQARKEEREKTSPTKTATAARETAPSQTRPAGGFIPEKVVHLKIQTAAGGPVDTFVPSSQEQRFLNLIKTDQLRTA